MKDKDFFLKNGKRILIVFVILLLFVGLVGVVVPPLLPNIDWPFQGIFGWFHLGSNSKSSDDLLNEGSNGGSYDVPSEIPSLSNNNSQTITESFSNLIDPDLEDKYEFLGDSFTFSESVSSENFLDYYYLYKENANNHGLIVDKTDLKEIVIVPYPELVYSDDKYTLTFVIPGLGIDEQDIEIIYNSKDGINFNLSDVKNANSFDFEGNFYIYLLFKSIFADFFINTNTVKKDFTKSKFASWSSNERLDPKMLSIGYVIDEFNDKPLVSNNFIYSLSLDMSFFGMEELTDIEFYLTFDNEYVLSNKSIYEFGPENTLNKDLFIDELYSHCNGIYLHSVSNGTLKYDRFIECIYINGKEIDVLDTGMGYKDYCYYPYKDNVQINEIYRFNSFSELIIKFGGY